MKKTDTHRKMYTLLVLLLTVAACLVAFFTARWDDNISETICTVALVPTNGINILSENPVRVKRGDSAAFSVEFVSNYYPATSDGVRYEDGVLYVDDVRESVSLHYTPGLHCSVSVNAADVPYVELLSAAVLGNGETATVRINNPEHYHVSRIRVNNQTLAVPATGTVSFPVYGDCIISAELEGNPIVFSAGAYPIGSILNLDEREQYRYGDEVILKPVCAGEDTRFAGWSEGTGLDNGGMLISFDEELHLTLTRNIEVYANYRNSHTYSVSIEPNGGSADKLLMRSDCIPGQLVYLPADTGVLKRKGYALVGYNTLPDGSGQHYAPSSPVMIDDSDVMLYAEWLPETPKEALSYHIADGCIVVTGAKRDIGDTLVLPSRIDGKRVKVVESRSFRGNTMLKTVVLPIGITYIGEYVLYGCPNLSTVYLPDTIEIMGEGSFDNCPSFEHLRILSANDTHAYEKSFGAVLVDKYMRLVQTEGKRIIVVAGSSASFGLDSAMLKERFPDYEIINFGGSYLFGIRPILSIVKNHIHEGDIVIFAPEYYDFMYGNELNGEEANWFYLESNFNILDEMNLQEVKRSILDVYVRFLVDRRKILPEVQEARGVFSRKAHNEYGDIYLKRTHQTNVKATTPNKDIIKSKGVMVFAGVFSEITAQNGVCLFSFPPVSVGGSSAASLAGDYRAFTDKLKKAFADADADVTVISDASDYLFPADMFYDNMYHMTNEGAVLRTKQLIADLEAYGLGA